MSPDHDDTPEPTPRDDFGYIDHELWEQCIDADRAAIARIFGVPIDFVISDLEHPMPDTPEPTPPRAATGWFPADTHGPRVRFEVGTPGTANNPHTQGHGFAPAVVDQRLAENLCVWCGQPLPDTAASDLFDSEGCAAAWRRTRADYHRGANPDREADWSGPREGPPPSWLGPQPGIDYTPNPNPVTVDPTSTPTPPPTTHPDLQPAAQPGEYSVTVDLTDAQPSEYSIAVVAGDDEGDVDGTAFWERLRNLIRGFDDEARRTVELDSRYRYVTGDNLTIWNGPELPAMLDYADPPAAPPDLSQTRLQYGVRYIQPEPVGLAVNRGHAFPPITPIVVGHDAARRNSQDTALHGPHIAGLPTLQDAKPPTEPRTGWPVGRLRRMEADGWTLLIPHGADQPSRSRFLTRWSGVRTLLPYRTCHRCGAHYLPTPVTAQWPTATAEHDDDGNPNGYTLTPQRMTKLCCSECLLPYPGPTMVPLVRPPGTWTSPDGNTRNTRRYWEYAAVSTTGHRDTPVTVEAQQRADHADLERAVWDEIYHGCRWASTPYRCCVPACDNAAVRWLLLAGALSWGGWMWDVHDGTPLHMGLCPFHHYHLLCGLYATPNADTWMGQSLMPNTPLVIP